ncbi:MAG: type II toxin-antitoxin system ParD family antitoxin [Burkholderiaceae bacterium]
MGGPDAKQLCPSPHFETFSQGQVKSGRYNNVSEVVQAGLCLF